MRVTREQAKPWLVLLALLALDQVFLTLGRYKSFYDEFGPLSSRVALTILLGIIWASLRVGRKAYLQDRSPHLRLILIGLWGNAIVALITQYLIFESARTTPAEQGIFWEVTLNFAHILFTALSARALMYEGRDQKWVSIVGVVVALATAVLLLVFPGVPYSTPSAYTEPLRILGTIASSLLLGSAVGHTFFGKSRHWRWIGAGWLIVVAYQHCYVLPAKVWSYVPFFGFYLVGYYVILEGLRRWTSPTPVAQAAENVRKAS